VGRANFYCMGRNVKPKDNQANRIVIFSVGFIFLSGFVVEI